LLAAISEYAREILFEDELVVLDDEHAVNVLKNAVRDPSTRERSGLPSSLTLLSEAVSQPSLILSGTVYSYARSGIPDAVLGNKSTRIANP
jgi:hypothetical protein